MKRHLILVGFMGTGKTTVGQLLAERMQRTLIDTDHYLEKRQQKTIPQIFESEGETSFREYEHAILKEVLQQDKPLVVTTGGGIVLRPDNVELMMTYGTVVALTASRAALLARLRADTNRPLLAGDIEQRLGRLLNERGQAYDFAHCHVDTTERTPRQIATEILKECLP